MALGAEEEEEDQEDEQHLLLRVGQRGCTGEPGGEKVREMRGNKGADTGVTKRESYWGGMGYLFIVFYSFLNIYII